MTSPDNTSSSCHDKSSTGCLTFPKNVYTPEKVLRMLADVITHFNPLTDVDICIRAGADVNGKVKRGLRPLHYAAYENYVTCIDFLVKHGADVNLSDDAGFTPLHIAAKHGQLRALNALLRHGAVVNFCDADTNNLRKISKTSHVLSELTVNPLNLAIENNNYQCVEALLQGGADPNQKYFLGYEITLVPLENIRCLELLLKYGANPNSVSRGGLTPLMRASKLGQKEASNVLIKYGADVNLQCPPRFDQKTALHFSAMTGNLEICKLLLEAGANTNIPPDYQYAPIDFAITQGKYEVCQMLLDYGADPNEMNGDNCSPLQVACTTLGLKRRKEIVDSLLLQGADPNFNSGLYSHIGPSLCPIVEYFSYSDEYDYNLVKSLVKNGSRINIRHPTRIFKIKDPCGILGYVRKLRPYEDILRFLLDAADSFDVDQIKKESSLSNRQKELLIEEGLVPKSLMHICRAVIRRAISPPISHKLLQLPLPKFLKDYLYFND